MRGHHDQVGARCLCLVDNLVRRVPFGEHGLPGRRALGCANTVEVGAGHLFARLRDRRGGRDRAGRAERFGGRCTEDRAVAGRYGEEDHGGVELLGQLDRRGEGGFALGCPVQGDENLRKHRSSFRAGAGASFCAARAASAYYLPRRGATGPKSNLPGTVNTVALTLDRVRLTFALAPSRRIPPRASAQTSQRNFDDGRGRCCPRCTGRRPCAGGHWRVVQARRARHLPPPGGPC